jgi:NADPH:quinone reductase-like Zn-dependent oxidoreductase
MRNLGLWYQSFGAPEDVLTLMDSQIGRPSARSIRVRMTLSPMNPSDLIPITGAYRHRVKPPLVAGYEGVGVVIDASGEFHSFIGKRVLPLRGTGTWQQYVDCSPE